jgi:hypothetical protein
VSLSLGVSGDLHAAIAVLGDRVAGRHEHRARRVADDALGGAAERQPAYGTPAARAEHEQIEVLAVEDELAGGRADHDGAFGGHALAGVVAGVGRRAVAGVLRALPDVLLVAEAGTAEELAREQRQTAHDVLVIDDRLLSHPGLGPRDAGVPVIVVGLDDDPSFARRADRLGAAAWVAKERADELLPDALARAMRPPGP